MTGAHDRNSQDYLRAIVSSDLIMPLVDGVSLHPFYGPSPAYPAVARYYNTYPSFVEELRTLATDSGFTGAFFADELTWRTPLNADPGQPWEYPEIVSAKYYARGILTHLGLDVTVGADVVIESEADNLAYHSFDLANGDQLFAIWTNGAAVEYDPGVITTLTFSFADGLPGSVEGIDVLQGYTQQLNIEARDNFLIIRDLWVKDYPLIIKFRNASQ
jgi:hypothetical protein